MGRVSTMIRMADQTPVHRRLLMVIMMVALTGLIIEVLSFVMLSLVERGMASWSRQQSERATIIGEDYQQPEADSDGEARQAKPRVADGTVERWMLRLTQSEVIHPYLGFVEQRREEEAAKGRAGRNAEAGRFGFPRNTYGLFHEPQPGRLVVVVVGGSFSRQIGFGGRRLLEEGLATIPRFQGRDVVVIALGLGGYKQPQQLMVLNYFLALGMHVDLLINIDGFNEVVLPVTENLRFGVSPFYPRAWNFRVGGLDPDELRIRGRVANYRDLRVRRAEFFARAPWRYSMTCSLIWQLLDRRAVGLTDRAESELRQRGEVDAGFQAMGPEFEVDSDDKTAKELVGIWRRCSLLLNDIARSNGIEYYHVLQPNQYVEASKPLSAEERQTAVDPETGIPGPVALSYPLLREAGRELRRSGLNFVDLVDVFSRVDESVYIDNCCHVNELGIELVAERIVESIAAGDGSGSPREERSAAE